MKKILVVLLAIFLISMSVETVSAATAGDPYIYQFLMPQNVSGADDLRGKLEAEAGKVIAAGHLAPFRALYGEGYTNIGEFYWYHNYDTVYTLSLIYPYVGASTQTAIKNYVKSEMQTYPVWNTTYLNPNTGTRRQPDILTAGEFGQVQPPSQNYANRPKLFALYALWLYAQNTGDWAFINTNWSSINSFYTANRTEVSKYYTSIAGSIGYARMAHQKTPPDTTAENTAIADINTGIANGQNFTSFGTNAETAFTYASGERWDYTKNGSYMGFQFIDISPEIGRYFFDNATLKTSVLSGDPTYSLNRGEFKFPLWYMAQPPIDSVYFGESSSSGPDSKAMIFPLKAWVQKQPASALRTYLDVPDALIGDYFYMQNTARTIEASGSECWENLTTTNLECPGPIFASGTPSPSLLSSPSPVPSPAVSPSPSVSPRTPGDIVAPFGKVDIFDYNQLLTDFGKKNDPNSVSDLDNDDDVDIFDYNLLLTNFGK